MSVFGHLVGQRPAIQALSAAARGQGMTHAWLFTGPPGSGRSNAAVAFAAALQCQDGGCGQCQACRTVLAGSHPDVVRIVTEKAQIVVDDMRETVRRAGLAPALGRWQIVIVEDADRLNDKSANALLKAIEEPTPRTVWMLCCPTAEDVLPTIRSRCRSVVLGTPSTGEVYTFLTDQIGIEPGPAGYAARASQGHLGRARALATDEHTRRRRTEVVRLPQALRNLGSGLSAAASVVEIAKEETAALTDESNERELADIQSMLGSDPKARSSRTYKAAVSALAESQRLREKRRMIDVIDRCLMDLMSVYRDLISIQLQTGADLVNAELGQDLHDLASLTTPEENLGRIDAIFQARERMMEFNTPPLLALESMMMTLMVSEDR